MSNLQSSMANKEDVERLSDVIEQPSTAAAEGTLSSQAEAPRAKNLPCIVMNTLAANKDFCGREDVLQRLAAELLPSVQASAAPGASLKQFALCSLGGMGKTEIAREFCRRHTADFDAVFWVVAEETAKLDHQYQEISLALGLEDASSCNNQVLSRKILKDWLANPQKQPRVCEDAVAAGPEASLATWLLVFDNADDPLILADYWPEGSGSILITSRDSSAKRFLSPKESGMDLKPLSQQESLSLFNHLAAAAEHTESDTASRLESVFNGIPLAISQMAGIMNRGDLTLKEFWELYSDVKGRSSLYETKPDTDEVKYRHSIATVWALNRLKAPALQLLQLISFFNPDSIAEDMLLKAISHSASLDALVGENSYQEARAALLQSSLIYRDTQKQSVSIHRLIQDAVLTDMDSKAKTATFESALQRLWAEWPAALPKPSRESELPNPKSSGQRLKVTRWPECSRIYPHVSKLHQLWSGMPEVSSSTALLFSKLLMEAAWYQKERGQTRHFDGFFDTALTICESSDHVDREAVLADIYFCLGAIAMDTNDFEASRDYKEKSFDLVYKICTEIGATDSRLYLAYSERGISRIQDERHGEAETDLREAIRILKSLGEYVPQGGEKNLGWALLAQGKLEECDSLLVYALALREAALGEDSHESVRTGLILYVLGNLRAAQGNWEESRAYHRRAWMSMSETVGDRDPCTAQAVHKDAEHLLRDGNIKGALDAIDAALNVWSIDPSAHKNEMARSTFLKGIILQAEGKLQKARAAFRVAARLRWEVTNEHRDEETLTMKDFDEIVAFWSR